MKLVKYSHKLGITRCEAQAKAIRQVGATLVVGATPSLRWENAQFLDAKTHSLDFNTSSLPFVSECLDVVVCEQVIEHLHNTVWFLKELHRILSPGGQLILATENLSSWPNLLAMLAGKTPFSCQHICGQFLGGWQDGPEVSTIYHRQNDPLQSGIHGHVRVMALNQLELLLTQLKFRLVKRYTYIGRHYILLDLRKE